MQQEYVPPTYNETAFNCPFCNAYSNQIWDDLQRILRSQYRYSNFKGAVCVRCSQESIWFKGTMIYPNFEGVQPPNEDLNDEIKEDYQEAASILQKSPRGSAALLRLAIQKLCIELGEDGENINNDIKSLVKKGLPAAVQKSLDVVRVIGNEAVHPGQIDLKDDVDTAKVLFKLVNLIAEKMITEPKEVEDIFQSLPEEKRLAIQNRDEKNDDE